ncbi:MAG: putative Ig domain-containing protein, partial [Gammaproteobacteria bacterium]
MHDSIGSGTGVSTAILISLVTLSGCGGGGGEAGKSALSLGAGDLIETTISGSVGDGPITDGRVAVQNVRGETLATQRSNEQARYRILLNASPDEYPLTATVDDGTDLVSGDRPSFALTTAILQAGGEQTANLNPHGTIAVKIAQQMSGGLTAENLSAALGVVNRNLGFGIDARAISDPIGTPIVEQNVASMIRSSEALGETVRRAHAALLSVGSFASEDDLIAALSADLIDGVLDGQGRDGSDPRLAATTSVVSAQVMLEVMTNRLMVGDVVATQALDASIQQVIGASVSAPLTGTLNTTGPMLNQARLLVDAAARIDADPVLDDLAAALAAIQPGESPAQVAALLPADAVSALGETVQQVSLATEEELGAVNDAIREAVPPIQEPSNRLPTIFGLPPTQVLVGSNYDFTPTAADADGDVLTFGVVGLPGWANFDMATGRITGTPSAADVATSAPIQLTVSDGFGTVSLPVFRITVEQPANGAPIISGTPPTTVTVGNLYSFTPAAEDPDGDALTFSIENLPAWATFDPATGTLTGTPQAADAGNYTGVQIAVADADDRVSLTAFMIVVSAIPNQAPVISGTPGTQVMVGNSYVFTPSASDADGDSLTFSITGMPPWASFAAATGQLSGTPADGDVGTHAGIRISVSDGRDSASLPAFSIVVAPAPNVVPTISGTPPTSVTAGDAYTFTPSAADADGDSLTFSIAGRPGWANFDPVTGRLMGTPAVTDVGTHTGISIRVSDGRDTTALPTFAITVDAPPNAAPTITGTPPSSVTVGSAYSFTPTASDPNGDSLTFSITGRPGWASFSSASGQLSGTPVAADIGTYGGIRISVTDGQETATLPEFSINVNDLPNRAPTVSGVPSAAVTIGSAYAFTPTASDPDGDALTFSI